jgi:7-cyano-7-deazaguanine synthase
VIRSSVVLVSGGLDSSLVMALCREVGIQAHPLFIDYGQRAAEVEWTKCREVLHRLGAAEPKRMNLSGFGAVIESGLTSTRKDVRLDAFTPCRNLLFLVSAAAFAFQKEADSLCIGLLSEDRSLFPDQRSSFLSAAERAIREALGRSISVLAPLSGFSKADVVAIAKEKGIAGTYSCHSGGSLPCGRCISCLEFVGT